MNGDLLIIALLLIGISVVGLLVLVVFRLIGAVTRIFSTKRVQKRGITYHLLR